MEDPNRQIVAFMAFAMAFGLIGHHVKAPSYPATTGTDVKILVGGAIGTVLLVLLAQAGDGPAEFAKGLAIVTLVSSILINGTPVFGAVSKLSGTPAKKVAVP